VYDKGFICGATPVRFQVNATNTDSIRFNFGDGISLVTTSTIVYHTYVQSGNYLPSADLLAGTSCHVLLQGVDTIKIDIVKAGFSIAQQKNCGTTIVAFTDTSRSFYGIQKWQWNYGDGTTLGIVKNPQHTYSTTNTWPLQLIVTSTSGCTDTINKPLLIGVNVKPTASISTSNFGCINQAVNYTANITSTDSVVLKLWILYNASNVTSTSVSVTYPAAATYLTKFVTGTINGCYDTAINSITIYPSPVVFANADLTLCQGQSTQLAASGAANYSWSPTNNLTCTTCPNPIAKPSSTTPYVVSTTNNFGCVARDTVLITVAQPFKIGVSANDSICIGQSTRLAASGANSYLWFPATGLSQTNVQSPLANPTVTTIYNVVGFDSYNCFTDTAKVVVGVGDYPVLKLGQDQVLAAGTLFTFNPTYTNGPIKDWRWKPATDLSCINCPTPIATAKNDICYEAIATNVYGCAATDTLCIKVFCQSTQVFIPNAFIPQSGAGSNEVLMVRGKGIKLVKSFRIFNRWGQVVFERANFTPNDKQYGWDGTIKGKLADPDVFVYTCEVVCENDVPFVYKGNVALLR
jgi:PKD repeat protein